MRQPRTLRLMAASVIATMALAGARHEEKFWAARFPNAITFLFPKATIP